MCVRHAANAARTISALVFSWSLAPPNVAPSAVPRFYSSTGKVLALATACGRASGSFWPRIFQCLPCWRFMGTRWSDCCSWANVPANNLPFSPGTEWR